MRFHLHHADYLDLQRGAKSFQELAGYTYLSANLTGGDIPDRVQAYRVTPNTFTMLGVNALVGRAFDARDVAGGRTDIAVISHALWQRRFGGDAGVIGRQIVVNDEPKEIVAVMPPRFEFPVFNFKGDLWVPSQLRGWERGQRAQFGGLVVVGRLRDGVAYAQAQSEVDLADAQHRQAVFRQQSRHGRPCDRDGQTRLTMTGRTRGDHPARHGRDGLAAGVRERRQPVARARRRASTRARRQGGDRRQPPQDRTPDDRRRRVAWPRRRRVRRRDGLCGARGVPRVAA